jgi:hypothetical protein
VAALRHAKPVHPRGALLPARIERHGLPEPMGAAWLDEAGEGTALARISRSAGLPEGWPDVWGLALRTAPGPAGDPADLLMVTSFGAPVARWFLSPRRSPGGPLSALLPYVTAGGAPVLLGARLEDDRRLPPTVDDLAVALRDRPARFALLASTSRGPWSRYGTVTVGGGATADPGSGVPADPDGDLSYDPVLNPLPGLHLPAPLALARARAYAGARSGRRAAAGTLDLRP